MTLLIPDRLQRQNFIASHLQEAGLMPEASNIIASKLIPDVLAFAAIFVSKTPCHCEILNKREVFLNLGGQVIYCGRYHKEGFAVRSAQSWNEFEYLFLKNEERLSLSLDALLATYNSKKWATEHSWYNNCRNKLVIDISPTLKQFVEVSNEAIH
tara:strand:+ start:18164 stop:18628 length:465 start_codon:yes stop_codon:yes gene_type:complete